MAKVICYYCKKKIDKDLAYIIPLGKTKHRYFCTKSEYYETVQEEQKKKDETNKLYNIIYECFGRIITNTVLFNEISSLVNIYGNTNVFGYLEENKDYLYDVMHNKIFKSDYAGIKYFSAILKNNLADYVYVEQDDEVLDYKIKYSDMDIVEMKYKQRERKRTLDEIEQGVIEEDE